jgi:uncharacterized membrane protein
LHRSLYRRRVKIGRDFFADVFGLGTDSAVPWRVLIDGALDPKVRKISKRKCNKLSKSAAGGDFNRYLR